MKSRLLRRASCSVIPVLFAMHCAPALACAVCYGKSDAPMARGMNWGIMVLLAIIGVVLSGVAGFFVFLARRPGLMPPHPPAGEARTPARG